MALDKELPGGEQLQTSFKNSQVQESPSRRFDGSNLKGESDFQAIGITPREEELALIESLTA